MHIPYTSDPSGVSVYSPTSWYDILKRYRRVGLNGLDGTGSQPIPYGLYTQTFVVSGHWVTESEMHVNDFLPLAFGYKFLCAFTYNRHSNVPSLTPVMFTGRDDSSPTDWYWSESGINAQCRHLGPALVRLNSTDIRFNPGLHHLWLGTDVRTNDNAGLSSWSAGAGGDPYISAFGCSNPTSANGGHRGDAFIGFFKPLHKSFDGTNTTNEIYFMIVNAMAPRNVANPHDARQTMTVDFDFSSNPDINSLLRLNRSTGLVETVLLTSLGNYHYRLQYDLNGGDGDLYKYNDGVPFILSDKSY